MIFFAEPSIEKIRLNLLKSMFAIEIFSENRAAVADPSSESKVWSIIKKFSSS